MENDIKTLNYELYRYYPVTGLLTHTYPGVDGYGLGCIAQKYCPSCNTINTSSTCVCAQQKCNICEFELQIKVPDGIHRVSRDNKPKEFYYQEWKDGRFQRTLQESLAKFLNKKL